MVGVVDAYNNIAESESMWKLLDPGMYSRRPIIVSVPVDTLYGTRNAFWLIDGNIVPKPAGRGSFRLITPSAQKIESSRGDITIACREITDPAARLADMDALGVQSQVIYPTLFLVYLTEDVELEIALCRAYNQWLSDVWRKSRNRMRWVAVLPLRSVEESLRQMKEAKTSGAVGVFFRGLEGDKTLDNPYFFPIYEQAARLDMPICIHTGSGAPWMIPHFDVTRNHTFAHSRMLPVIAFRDIVANRIPEAFPGLRFGFIEAAAGWVPYLVHVLRRLLKENWNHRSTVDLFRTYNIYVACEADEDIPYLVRYTGEDNLIIGSDYGHNDPSEERQLVASLQDREDLTDKQREKILVTNPTRFYGL
jgi:predicted TIM-barrel fold metal-dependent hydrolase